jgi:hypothetical protein
VKRRQYTLDDYRRDVATLYSIRRSDAPGVSDLLDEALTTDAELAAVEVEELPPVSAVHPRRPRASE